MRRGLLAVAAAAATVAACRARDAPRELLPPAPAGAVRLSEQQQRALGLELVVAREGDLPDVSLRFGRVRARLGEDALVVSPVAGRIDRPAPVALGESLVAGATLLEIVPVLGAGERVSLGVQGAEIEGQIESAARELAARQAEAARDRELAKDQIVSAERLQRAETAVATTRARLDALRRARGLQARGEGGAIALRAPVAGTVVALDAPVGAVVRAGDTLARILRPGPRWVDVAVPPDDLVGTRYEVQVASSFVPARLVSRGAVVEEDGARHDRLELGAEHAARVLPGSTVVVRVAVGPAQGVIVPESALVPGVGEDRVWVAAGDGAFSARAVKVAARFGGQARIAAGLRPGERVVARGAMALRGEEMRRVLGAAPGGEE